MKSSCLSYHRGEKGTGNSSSFLFFSIFFQLSNGSTPLEDNSVTCHDFLSEGFSLWKLFSYSFVLLTMCTYTIFYVFKFVSHRFIILRNIFPPILFSTFFLLREKWSKTFSYFRSYLFSKSETLRSSILIWPWTWRTSSSWLWWSTGVESDDF